MGRCIYCHGLIADNERFCYTCGDDLRKHQRARQQGRTVAHPRSLSGRTDVVFFASLAVTAYSFFVEHALSAPGALAIAAGLLVVRFVAEGHANKKLN